MLRPLLLILFSYFLTFNSAANLLESKKTESDMNIMLIIPEDAVIPDYTPLGDVVNEKINTTTLSKHYPPASAKSYLNHLSQDLLTLIFSYLSFEDIGKMCTTSSYFHDAVENSLHDLMRKCEKSVDLSTLTRMDQVIVILHLLPVFRKAYPGLITKRMSSADLICLSLLAFVASSNLSYENKTLIMPSSKEFMNLLKAFSSLNFIISAHKVKYNHVAIFLRSCATFTVFFMIVTKSGQTIPYALEAVSVLAKLPSVNNSQFNAKSIPLLDLGLNMVSDQRFIHNFLNSMSANDLITAKCGHRHGLHEFIVKGFEYVEEIFSRPELSLVKMDSLTQADFYEAALIYSVFNKNWSCLKGLLNFPDSKFPRFSIGKLDSLRTANNFDEIFLKINHYNLIFDLLIN